MKVQEVLENYNLYKARITMAEAEIEELKNDILEEKSPNIDGMPKAKGLVSSNIEIYITEKEEKIGNKRAYITNLKTKIIVVENLVRTLKKYNQDIIEMRFYNMMSIEEIAVKKDRTYGAIKKSIDRSIRILQREYDKNKKCT